MRDFKSNEIGGAKEFRAFGKHPHTMQRAQVSASKQVESIYLELFTSSPRTQPKRTQAHFGLAFHRHAGAGFTRGSLNDIFRGNPRSRGAREW